MDARSVIQRIVVILVITGGTLGSPVFADAVTVTYGGPFNLPIPEPDASDPHITKGWMEDAVITVPNHFNIYDLDVCITVTHTSAFDLQIYLQSPAGTQICLNMYTLNEFFKGENYIDTIFDDEADIAIEDGVAPFTGSFRPEEGYLLEVFDGQDAYGDWLLKINDAYYSDTGNLDSFELIFAIPEPSTLLLLVVGSGLSSFFRRRQGH